MRTHDGIDRRSLALAQAVVEIIDRDPAHAGLGKARQTCARWMRETPSRAVEEWCGILGEDWERVRLVLLDPGPEGRRLRQSSPFGGILTPRQRWDIYRQFSDEHCAA